MPQGEGQGADRDPKPMVASEESEAMIPRSLERQIGESPRLLFTRCSAARTLGVPVRMINCAITAGLLEVRRLNSRILIPSDSLAKFAASDRAIPGMSNNGWGGRRAGAGRKPKNLAQAAALARIVS